MATDIYKQIAGQFNFNMGAVVSTLLLIPAVITFAVDRIVNKNDLSEISSKAIVLKIKNNRTRDGLFLVLCSLVASFFLLIAGSLIISAFTNYYPYDMGLTLRYFQFDSSTGCIQSFFHSFEMSFLTALLGTAFVFVYAYLIEKSKGMEKLKKK